MTNSVLGNISEGTKNNTGDIQKSLYTVALPYCMYSSGHYLKMDNRRTGKDIEKGNCNYQKLESPSLKNLGLF